MAKVNLKTLTAALHKKQADLDMLDDQLLGLDAALPPDAAPTAEFDLLSQKREELEADIRKMREGVQLITEWEKFKGGQWSEEVKQALDGMDMTIADAAGPMATAPVMDLGAPAPDAAALPPVAPPAPAAPAPALAAPAAPEAPAPAEVAPEATSEEAPLPAAAPVASANPKKSNYEAQNKKGDLATKETKMANQETKPSLKQALADQKSKREAIKKEAQSRVASAWTIAKTMLPTAPAEVQKAFAASLLANPTKVLQAALRQTAVNAHFTRIAEDFKKVHKMELNDPDLLEKASVLAKEKAGVESEIKGEAKNASTEKVADDRKDAGPQPEKYNDGRNHSEPAELESSHAGDRPPETVNKSESGSNNLKEASAKTACIGEKCAGCEGCKKAAEAKKAEHKCSGANCPECKKATSKKADEPLAPEAPAGLEAPAAPEAPAEEGAPAAAPEVGELPMGEEGDAAQAEVVLNEEKQLEVHEKIEEAEQAIQALEAEILEEGNEELDIEQIFNDENMDDKVSSLANEGEKEASEDDFFAPSAAAEMEANLDGEHFGSMDEIFSMQGADADPLAALIAGDLKTAAQVEGMEVLPSFSGELANHFNEQNSDDRSRETDHEGDLLAEAAEAVKPEDQGAKRTPQDQRPELKEPKEAAVKPAAKPAAKAAAKPAIRHIKASAPAARRVVNPVAAALFGDDEF